jgi:glycerol-3-phosphate dehydrogenase
MAIRRAPAAASRRRYDLIVVGGGIYGAMLALEAALRNCSVLVVEQADFGGGTSYNSLRIIHGGLRDLKRLHLRRYWAFGRERRWFLDHFPHLVTRLPVLVPLYQRGLMRTQVLRAAFWLDGLLRPSQSQEGSPKAAGGLRGQVLSANAVRQRCPGVAHDGLAGGALWYDAGVPISQRVLVEVLRAACARGATALNYVSAQALHTRKGHVAGVRGRDRCTGTEYRFGAKTVVNAAGPWGAAVARRFGAKAPDRHDGVCAWNVLFDRAAPTQCAVGARPPGRDRYFFLRPWHGRVLMGTGHAARRAGDGPACPTPAELRSFVRAVNGAFPRLDLQMDDILHVYAGRLPAQASAQASLAVEDRWVDHAVHGGPSGLFSVQGTKFTAARHTAEQGMIRLFPDRAVSGAKRRQFLEQFTSRSRGRKRRGGAGSEEGGLDVGRLAHIVRDEAVVHLDDLVLRRTALGDDPRRACALAPQLCDLFPWSDARRRAEVRRVRACFPYV